MPHKNPNAERFGGPGSSHENRAHPEKSEKRGPHPTEKKSTKHSGVSGGGGEPDTHHTHSERGKAGR